MSAGALDNHLQESNSSRIRSLYAAVNLRLASSPKPRDQADGDQLKDPHQKPPGPKCREFSLLVS